MAHDEAALLYQLGVTNLTASLHPDTAAAPHDCATNRPSWGWQPPGSAAAAAATAATEVAAAAAAWTSPSVGRVVWVAVQVLALLVLVKLSTALALAAYRRASEGGAPPSRRKYAPYPAAVVEGHADSSEYLPFAEAQAGRGGAAALAEAAERGSEHRAAPPPKYPGHYLPPAAPEAGL